MQLIDINVEELSFSKEENFGFKEKFSSNCIIDEIFDKYKDKPLKEQKEGLFLDFHYPCAHFVRPKSVEAYKQLNEWPFHNPRTADELICIDPENRFLVRAGLILNSTMLPLGISSRDDSNEHLNHDINITFLDVNPFLFDSFRSSRRPSKIITVSDEDRRDWCYKYKVDFAISCVDKPYDDFYFLIILQLAFNAKYFSANFAERFYQNLADKLRIENFEFESHPCKYVLPEGGTVKGRSALSPDEISNFAATFPCDIDELDKNFRYFDFYEPYG